MSLKDTILRKLLEDKGYSPDEMNKIIDRPPAKKSRDRGWGSARQPEGPGEL